MEVQDRRSDSGGTLDLDLEMPAQPSMLADMRCALGELRLPAPVLDDARLLVSELVANSIKHAGLGPDDRIHVKAEIDHGRLRVDVLDGGRAGDSPLAGGIRPTPGAESGWGLYLVETVAARWGRGPGRYWFELEVHGRPHRSANPSGPPRRRPPPRRPRP
jgi:anti-sigma regulatory factor (Ser/Thr protein kinase)